MSDKNIPGHLYAFFANVMWGLMSPIGKSALQIMSSFFYYSTKYKRKYDKTCKNRESHI